MAAYVFFDAVPVHPERMTGYRDKAFASVEAFGGKLVARTNNIDCREGDWHPTRIVMLEFRAWRRRGRGMTHRSIKRFYRSGSMHTETRWSYSRACSCGSPTPGLIVRLSKRAMSSRKPIRNGRDKRHHNGESNADHNL